MATEDVTHGEIMREIQRLHERYDRMERTFQPRDLAEAMAANVMARVTDLGNDLRRLEDSATANRRLALGALVYPLLVAVVVALATFAIRG